MKYMLLIYSNPRNWAHPVFLHQHKGLSEAERAELMAEFQNLIAEISESGELLGNGTPLADPAESRVVRVRKGAKVTTDGPFAEAKEQLAGYFVVDCESRERAEAIAARFPDARTYAVEVRPIMTPAGMEM